MSDGPRPNSLEARLERGSFRDRTARVFYLEGKVFRALDQTAFSHWTKLSTSRFFRDAMARGRVVRTEVCDDPAVAQLCEDSRPAAVLIHERIPFVSYPYEWPFGMLKDAALLSLELQLDALSEGFSLKDATPYNVQWRGSTPTFIDIPSFEHLVAGGPWTGYRQFCELFLYPLLLQAYKHIPFQPWLRGSIDGIAPEHIKNLMSARDYLRAGVFSHVYLQAKLEARYGRTTRDVRAELRDAGFSHDLIRANVRRLRSIVASLRWQPPVTASSADRGRDDDDDSGDAERRRAFVTQVLRSRRRSLVWDLWCRTGFFARLAAAHADYVVAINADQGALERLFQQLRRQELPNVLPLCINLADPSPGLGWRGVERQPLDARGVPDLVLCLAYLPHLVIGSNVRLRDVLDWLASVSEELIIEFVTRDDPMVQQLLHNREDHYSDYQQDVFDVELSSRYHVLDRTVLANGARILFYGRRRVAA